MNGDYGLKNIIKAIPSDVSYEKKDNISFGNEDQLAWFIYTDPNTSSEQKKNRTFECILRKGYTSDLLLKKFLIEKSFK